MIVSLLLLVGVALAVPVPESKRLLGTASENPIDLEKILQLINAVGKRQIEDNLWDDIVNGVESAYEWLTSPEVLSVVSAGAYPIGKRQVEDGLWEDIVNVVVKAGEALIENSGPLGKRQVKKERRLLAHLVTLVYPIFDGVGKRQA